MKKYFAFVLFLVVNVYAVKSIQAQHLFIKGAFYIAPTLNSGIGSRLEFAMEGKIKNLGAQIAISHFYKCHYDCVALNQVRPEVRYYVYNVSAFQGFVFTSYSYTEKSVSPEDGDFYHEYINALGIGIGNKFVFDKWVSLELGIGPAVISNNRKTDQKIDIMFSFLLGINIL